MPCKITNISIEPCTLPFPMTGILPGTKSVIINLTAAQVTTLLGGSSFLGGIDLEDLPDYTGPYDSFFQGAGSSSGSYTIATHVIPATTNTYDLGTGTYLWRTLYIGTSIVVPTVGPTAARQHTLPNVASDTVALLAATQTLAAKTLTTPVVAVDHANTNDVQVALTVRRTVTGGAGTNGVGAQELFRAPDDAGAQVDAGAVEAALTDVTAAAPIGRTSLLARCGAALVEGFRVLGIASAVRRIGLRLGATGVNAALVGEGENGAGIDLRGDALGTPGSVRIRNPGNSATVFGVQPSAAGTVGLTAQVSDDSGTPGAATANVTAGVCSVAIGAASVVITNNLVTANSLVFAQLGFIDATFTQILSVVPAAGSFTITGNAVATAATRISWLVINPSS